MSAAPSSLNVLQQVSAQGGAQAGVGSSLDVLNHVAADPTYGMPKYADDEGMTKSADGSFVITPKEGEEFSDTMQRAAAAGKTVSPELVQKQAVKGLKEAPAVLAAAPVIGAAGAAVDSGAAGEAIGQTIGPAASKLLGPAAAIGKWASQNPGKAMLAYIMLKKSGVLDTFHDLEMPLLLLFGSGTAAEGEAAGAEAATAEKALATEGRAATTAKAAESETADQFVNRVTKTPEGQTARSVGTPDAAGKDLTPESADAEDSALTKEQRQAAVDKYFAEHPEKAPKPEIWQRGPKAGQPKTYKVFQDGKWIEVPRYK
jgi:hypothetical protein